MRLRIILAFHIALIYYTQDFRVYEGTRDQPMSRPFPAPPIFQGKSPGDKVDITRDMCFPGREHISLGIGVYQGGEHISLGIGVSQGGEYISLGICVSQVENTYH